MSPMYSVSKYNFQRVKRHESHKQGFYQDDKAGSKHDNETHTHIVNENEIENSNVKLLNYKTS